MPEISNNFRLGRMEKDLDDRLVPNGAYRDALNVEVATSEGSDVGALQKVLGNAVITGLPTLTNATCIGSVRDTQNNKIYWFITSSGADVIAEYDGSSIDLILVDTSSVLNFSTSNLIIGANVLDNVLYFTDNLNEPRRVDIEYWRNKTTTTLTTSLGLTAYKITVIRKSPLNALTYTALPSTVVTGAGTIDGDQIQTFINGDSNLILSTFSINDSITNITFKKQSDNSAVAPSYVNNSTEVILTNSLGQTATILITAQSGSAPNVTYTGKLLQIDSNIATTEQGNAITSKTVDLAWTLGVYSANSGLSSHLISGSTGEIFFGTLSSGPTTLNSVTYNGFPTNAVGTDAIDFFGEIPIAGSYSLELSVCLKNPPTISGTEGQANQGYTGNTDVVTKTNLLLFAEYSLDEGSTWNRLPDEGVKVDSDGVTVSGHSNGGSNVGVGIWDNGENDATLQTALANSTTLCVTKSITAASYSPNTKVRYRLRKTGTTNGLSTITTISSDNATLEVASISTTSSTTVISVRQTNGSAISSATQINAISSGMIVTSPDSGSNIPRLTRVISVDNSANTITVDKVLTVSAGTNLNFNGTYAAISSSLTGYDAVAKEALGKFQEKFPTFSFRYKYSNNQYSTFAPFSLPAFVPGNFRYLTKDGFNAGMLNSITSATVTGWSTDITSQFTTISNSLVEEIELLYKTSNDQNVYIVDTVKKISQSFTGNGSNTAFTLTTSGYSDPLPSSKDEFRVKIEDTLIDPGSYAYSSPNVTFNNNYIITDLQESTGAPKNSKTVVVEQFESTYTIEDNEIYKVVDAIQLLRNFDAVPKKALAQEIIGNRILYANYTESFNDTGILSFAIVTAARTDSLNQRLSLKSNRTYQFGVVFQDQYGRKTPVFTGENSTHEITKDSSNIKNQFKVTTTNTGTLNSDFTHFKYFIKETSKEYYNIAISNYYDDGEGFAYLSAPSADRNKVSENDYLVFKKQNGTTLKYDGTNDANRYKVIDILNDPPQILNRDLAVTNGFSITFGDKFASQTLQNDKKPGITPVSGFNKIQIRGVSGANNISSDASALLKAGAKIRFRTSTKLRYTKAYEVASVRTNGSAGSTLTAEVTFKNFFTEDVDQLYSSTNTIATTAEFVTETETIGNSHFDGKFFIKIKAKDELKRNFDTHVDTGDFVVLGSAYRDVSGSAVTGAYQFGTITAGTNNKTITITTDEAENDADSKYEDDNFFNNITTGNYIRISDTNFNNELLFANYYEITAVTKTGGGSSAAVFTITISTGLLVTVGASEVVRIDLANILDEDDSDVSNPAVFEVEPENGLLDLYYETQETFAIADLGSQQTLSYTNVISFDNGVESDRIRDDFNAPVMGKGVRVSTVTEDVYAEENFTNRFIFSQIYNNTSGINRLNQFIIADKITKDINPSHGSIQLIKTRDTDLLALCEDKCFRVQANKDALFTADGNTQVTASTNVLGQIIPYVGEYGISKNPESFAQYGFRAYFADKERGVVLRLSRDGLSEISALGMSDFFSDKLANVTSNLFGSYDDRKNSYNLSFTNQANSDPTETISFNERINGWTSRKSYVPETAISLNNDYFSFKAGSIYKHHNSSSAHAEFYGVTLTNKCTVKLVMNQPIGQVKRFKTLNYLGDLGWLLNSITTSESVGALSSDGFVKKEGRFFATLTGTNADSSSLNADELQVEGLGIHSGVNGNILTFSNGVNSNLQVGDNVYFLLNNAQASYTSLGTATAKTATTVTVSVTPSSSITSPNKFVLFDKGGVANQSGLLGFFAEVELKHTTTTAAEIFSVGSRIVK